MRCRKKKEGVCDALCFNRNPYNHAAFLGRLLSGDDMADEFAFPAMPVTPDKKGEKPELPVGHVSGIDRQLSASPLEPFSTQLGADSDFDISKNMRQCAVMPRIDYKRHIGG